MQPHQPRVHTLLFPLHQPYGSPKAEAAAHRLLIRVMELSGVKSASVDLDAGHISVGIDPAHADVQALILSILNETKDV